MSFNRSHLNQNPKCEPQLGKRGLYRKIGGQTQTNHIEVAMLCVLNFADGDHSLLDIAEKSGSPFSTIKDVASPLLQHQLLEMQPERAAANRIIKDRIN